MTPPTVGELIAALRHCREGFAVIGGADSKSWAAAVLMARIDTILLDGILERIDTPPDANQPRDVSEREGFA